jgi:hypothetical protein
MTEAEHRVITGGTLQVHRLKPGTQYTVEGCVTVCQECHGKRHLQLLRSGEEVRRKAQQKRDDRLSQVTKVNIAVRKCDVRDLTIIRKRLRLNNNAEAFRRAVYWYARHIIKRGPYA